MRLLDEFFRRSFVVHGLTDTRHTLFSENCHRCFASLRPDLQGEGAPCGLRTYGGGHMFYDRETSRRAFREDAKRLYRVPEAAR